MSIKTSEARRTLERLRWFHDNDMPALRALADAVHGGVTIPPEARRSLTERGLVSQDGKIGMTVLAVVLKSVRRVNGVPTIVS